MAWITAFFTEGFAPKTGLSPTVDIWRLSDDVQVVTAGAFTEVGGGSYKYNFAAYDEDEEYFMVADGGATLANMERYKYGGSEDADNKSIVFCADVAGGRWKIDESTNELLLYKADNVTLVATFDLTDMSGTPTYRDIFERSRA